MKYVAFFIFLVILNLGFGCDHAKKFDDKLSGLEKSYVLNKKNTDVAEQFYRKYKITQSQFLKDSIDYYNSLKYVIHSDNSIIGKLLEFENDNHYCFWIKTADPYSSIIEEGDVLTRSEAAKVLIDNYILDSMRISYKPYIKKIQYSWLKEWYKVNSSKGDLRKLYSDYVEKR